MPVWAMITSIRMLLGIVVTFPIFPLKGFSLFPRIETFLLAGATVKLAVGWCNCKLGFHDFPPAINYRRGFGFGTNLPDNFWSLAPVRISDPALCNYR